MVSAPDDDPKEKKTSECVSERAMQPKAPPASIAAATSSAALIPSTAARRGASYPSASTAPSPGSDPASTAAATAPASAAASPSPRFRPCPARGCTACAASPTNASRGRENLRAGEGRV
ncbi:hypothetical protein TSOC_001487 [Tetrabaena socialis]|uniref:Uncharacterized protein n=1 Tax=Tetrabaena socialis TaxID=47790 RepID=A0A2J8AGK6_9CHLO|nr:hypothetical protein TSOC_001487 [Tetrabaena socialis]|eukprot:PNH11650.1 hypothetical protein TSOC_001487 [Tetrabaena socialis]